MTSRRLYYAAVLAVCALVFLPACHQEKMAPPAPPPPPVGTMHTITLSVSGGICQQSEGGVSTPLVKLDPNDTVTFQSSGGVPFTVEFPPPGAAVCNSPFPASGACQSTFNNANPSSGPAGGPISTNYFYKSLAIGPTTCDLSPGGGTGPLGMRMKP